MKTSSFFAKFLSPVRRQLRKKIWQLTLPVIFANITIPLVGLVDTAVMGQLDSAHYIGAVALGAFIYSMVSVSFGFLRMATTGLVAQAFGAEDVPLIQLHLMRGTALALAVGVMVILIAQPLIMGAELVLSASDDVLEGMSAYVSIIAFASPATCFNMVALGLLFGLQRVRACMIQMVVINLANIALNLWLVFGIGMKVEGVALATLLAQYLGAGVSVLLIVAALGRFRNWHLPPLKDIISLSSLSQYLGLGRDLTIRTLGILLGEVVVLNMSAAIDDVTLAASQLCFVLFGLVAYGLDGFAHAAESLVGVAIGRRDVQGLRSAIAESTFLAFMMSIVGALLILMFGSMYFEFMTGLEDVRARADELLIWMAALPVVSVLAFQMDGVFIGATAAKIMRNAMMVSVLIFLPLAFFGNQLAGINGIWGAFLVLLGIRGVTLLLKIRHVYDKARSTDEEIHAPA